MRALFFGTPEIAVPSLLALLEVAEVVGVVCQPDRPAGRGLHDKAPAVKEAALARGLEVIQPLKVKDGSLEAWVKSKNADVAVVIAYGRILPEVVLFAPRAGSVNLHASLLPKYRGSAPIQRALLNGETETGVCLMKMDAGMDTGAILSTHVLAIEPTDDAGSLAEKLGKLAAEVTRVDVPRWVRGELSPLEQDHASATHAPPIEKADTILSFVHEDARELVDHVRGLSPRPGAATNVLGAHPKRLRIVKARVGEPLRRLAPGEVGIEGARLFVGARAERGQPSPEAFEIEEAQLEGKKVQAARDLINGRAVALGTRLGEPNE